MITEIVQRFCKHIESLKLSHEIINRKQNYYVAISILSYCTLDYNLWYKLFHFCFVHPMLSMIECEEHNLDYLVGVHKIAESPKEFGRGCMAITNSE